MCHLRRLCAAIVPDRCGGVMQLIYRHNGRTGCEELPASGESGPDLRPAVYPTPAGLVLMARTSAGRPSRFPGTIEQTAEECRERGARVEILSGDVARLEDCQRCAQVTTESFGRCDILVNNAGINPVGNLDELPLRLFQRGFEVNVFGPFMLTQALLPLLKQAPGSFIINVSSGAARAVSPGWAVYSASKAALDRMS